MKTLKYIRTIINKISYTTGMLTSLLLIPLTLFSAYEVFQRYVMNAPTIWVYDLNIQLMAAIAMLGGGYTLYEKGHVSVDVIVMNLSPQKRALLHLIMSFLLFFAMSVLIWNGSQIAWESLIRNERVSTIWGPPAWTIKFWVPIGAGFLMLQGLSNFIENLLILLARNGHEEND
jgi:TRAP-type mannitol/chloroaromatic compound transport system permease small subunit